MDDYHGIFRSVIFLPLRFYLRTIFYYGAAKIARTCAQNPSTSQRICQAAAAATTLERDVRLLQPRGS